MLEVTLSMFKKLRRIKQNQKKIKLKKGNFYTLKTSQEKDRSSHKLAMLKIQQIYASLI